MFCLSAVSCQKTFIDHLTSFRGLNTFLDLSFLVLLKDKIIDIHKIHLIYIMQVHPWSRFLLERLIVTHLVKKFPTFYRIQRFVIVFTRACYWSLS